MTLQSLVAWTLALAVLASCVRLSLGWYRHRGDVRAWRWVLMLIAQPFFAGLLYFTLYPPLRTAEAVATLSVLTEGSTTRDAVQARTMGPVFALPEAPVMAEVDRVPDLGTALRRHPEARRLRVVGAGLPMRDRDAVRDIAVEPVPVASPRGLSRLQLPTGAVAGGRFLVSGSIHGVEAGQVELLDPAGQRVDAVVLDAGGDFALEALAFVPGAAHYGLRVLDADGMQVQTAAVPVWVEAALSPRVLLLAGAPGPETRALQRWMQDAGFDVRARIALGAGVQLGDAPALTTDTMSRTDVLVIDARAWDALGEGGRMRVMQAVDAGMGLLLRADAAMPASSLRPLQASGFAISGGAGTVAYRPARTRLDDEAALRARMGPGSTDAPVDVASAAAALPEFARRAWRVTGARAIPLQHDASGAAIAWWRAQGQGRLAFWSPLETWRLPLLGRRDLHADAWNTTLTTLARPRERAAFRISGDARVDARIAMCAVSTDAVVEAADGSRVPLVPDPAARGCAAYWPAMPGWHRLHDGEATQAFHVRATDELPTLRLQEMRDATAALERADAGTGSTVSGVRATYRMSSWPWFATWLALAAVLWAFERSRWGRSPARPGEAG